MRKSLLFVKKEKFLNALSESNPLLTDHRIFTTTKKINLIKLIQLKGAQYESSNYFFLCSLNLTHKECRCPGLYAVEMVTPEAAG
jgi:hypothetical protein